MYYIISAVFYLSGFYTFQCLLYSPAIRLGLDYLWVLPLCGMFFLQDMIRLSRNKKIGIGFYILIVILYLKYIVLPYIMWISGGYLHYIKKDGSIFANKYCVVAMVVELATIWISAKVFLKRFSIKDSQHEITTYSDDISCPCWILIVLVLGIAFVRYDRFINSISFFLFNKNEESFGSIEQIFIQVIKSFLFMYLLYYAKKKYDSSRNPLYILASLIVGFMCCALYFGENRSLVVQTFIASFAVFGTVFPKTRSYINILSVVMIATIVVSISSSRHFKTETQNLTRYDVNIEYVSEQLESYLCGPWPITSSIDSSNDYICEKIGPQEVLSDFVCNFFPFMLPGLDIIRKNMAQKDNSSILYNENINNIGGMIPMVGECSFYFGNYLGFLFDVLVFIAATFILIRSSYLATQSKSVYLMFYHSWVSVLFAFTPCYCLITLLWCWSKFGMIFYLLYYFNTRFISKKENALLENTDLKRKPQLQFAAE